MRSMFGCPVGRHFDQIFHAVRRGVSGAGWTGAAASTLLCFFAAEAAAEDYTRCLVPSSSYVERASEYCIPASFSAVRNRGTIRVGKDPTHEHVVLALPARNCRGPSGIYRGELVLLLDSSQSLEKTDPKDERMVGTDGFIDTIRFETEGDPIVPRLGVVSYGGRLRFQQDDPERPGKILYQAPVPNAERPEAWSPKYDDRACLDGDDLDLLRSEFPERDGFESQFGPFSTRGSELRWNERVQATDRYPLSICEFLRLVSVGTDSAEPTTPGLTRQGNFLRVAQGSPRGATDVAYMLDTIAGPTLFGQATSETARHAIIITDGLPNAPVRRPKDFCLKYDFLKNEIIETDYNSPVLDPFCLDRNFRAGVEAAHAKVIEKFGEINIHHILYWSQPGESFIDEDEQGTLNPADFLIENSARSGNGKVKFDAAQGPEELSESLAKVLQRLDQNALQRVEITVTPAGESTRPTYTAVSASDFPEDLQDPFDQRFDLKILYLKPGINTVRVDYYYADTTVSEDLRVEVVDNFSSTSELVCETASSNFTVDGDRKDYPYCLNRDSRDKVPPPPLECSGENQPVECTCAAPKGDGFLPFPDSDGNIRVYRNADATNEEFEDQSQFARVVSYDSDRSGRDPSTLRIQGGTGNCGVIGSHQGLGPKLEGRMRWLGSILLVIPALVLIFFAFWLFIRRRFLQDRAATGFTDPVLVVEALQVDSGVSGSDTRRDSR